MLREGTLEDKEVEVQVAEQSSATPIGAMDMPGMPPGQMANIQEMMGKMFGRQARPRKMQVAEARIALTQDEADRLLDNDKLTRAACSATCCR
jgi:ATP-dependent HslUV protease ATP-binding subunit HslU